MQVNYFASMINQSQNLFPSTGQLFNEVDHITSPDYIHEKGYTQHFPDCCSSRVVIAQDAKLHKRKFIDSVKRNSDKLDIDNIFNSQLNSSFSVAASPPLAPYKKPTCFQVPFLQEKADSSTKTRVNKSFPCNSAFNSENMSKVESFINRATGSSGQTINSHKLKQGRSNSALSNNKRLLHQKPAPVSIIPETPKVEKFSSASSVFNTSDLDIIENSDEEYKGEIYGPCLQTPGKLTLPPISTSGGRTRDGVQLRSVEEIPHRYRNVFDKIPYFNIVQSKVFDDTVYTDKSLVVCAPTGSGKTVVFELAIIRLLLNHEQLFTGGKRSKHSKPKIVYMAPIKALCTERHEDWSMKFHALNLSCRELTGDTVVDEFWQLQSADIILTTPEKWDSMTRRWRDNSSLVRQVKLFLIDEVHLLNDESRGATMEAVVSRMKTIQSSLSSGDEPSGIPLRFVAVSATIPNTEDIAEWLGSSADPALAFLMDDSYRPVALRKVVLGYPWAPNGSEFKFDISLNYKLGNVIQTYSENKPTLVFCATRKSVEQAASTLAKDLVFITDAQHKQTLNQSANLVRNHRLRELLQKGIGYHHAGLDSHDRHLTEELFTQGDLLVLVSTSTLAMGVNLPAHLVVIKSTCHYAKGMFQEYTQSEILQMIGRAGRPQFDTSATAVIMTRNQSRGLYQNVVNGTQKIESSLHRHLIEHLNAEIVLSTIHDVTIALEWIRSTFLYIRLLKNPTHYGYPANLTKAEAENRLHELCMRNLDSLTAANLVSVDNELRLMSNEPGRLMARYSIAFETIKKFSSLTGLENLSALIEMLSSCHEFQDITLRMSERSSLNKMNKDKNRITIRYPMTGKIKTTSMKVNCLLQATLGCITVQDFALTQDVTKIFRSAVRVTKCLVELQMLKEDFKLLHSAALLAKCAKAKLWENSRYVTKQLPAIGATLSNALANAGICSFEKLESTDPREIELILNRHPPFGNHLREAVKCLPKYLVRVEQGKRYRTDGCDITVQVVLNNAADLKEKKTAGTKHGCLLLIGDADNRTIMKQRLSDNQLITSNNSMWVRTVSIERATKGDELSVNLISQEWVGLDVESTYTPYYLGPRRMIATSSGVKTDVAIKESKYFDKKRKPCRHTCTNKMTCAHECCKVLPDGSVLNVASHSLDKPKTNGVQSNSKFTTEHLQKFRYNNTGRASATKQSNQVVPSTPSLQRSKGWEQLDSFCETQQTQDLVDDAMLETMNAFEREQGYYEDQINLGSRIKSHDALRKDVSQQSEMRKDLDQQLWTEDAPTQVDDIIEEDIADIRPRVSKYGFKMLARNKDKQASNEVSDRHSTTTPTRMGKVFAWKSETAPKPNAFIQMDSKLEGSKKLATIPMPPNSRQGSVSSKDCISRSESVNNILPCTKSCVSLRDTSQSNPSCLSTSFSSSIHQNPGWRARRSGLPLKTNRNERISLKPTYSNQLWEETLSYAYPPPAKKRVSFFDAFPVSQNLDPALLRCEDNDISINCDFSLEDDDEDELEMMKACIQAEESENSIQRFDHTPGSCGFSEVDVSVSYPVSSALPSAAQSNSKEHCSVFLPNERRSNSVIVSAQRAAKHVSHSSSSHLEPSVFALSSTLPAGEKPLSQFFGIHNEKKPTSAKKASEMADARKMFDSIFDGIF